MNKPHKYQKEIIAWANGEEVEVYSPITDSWMKAINPIWGEGYDFRIKPEREYPKTSLTNDELFCIYDNHEGDCRYSLSVVANAVIRRYIDDQEGKE